MTALTENDPTPTGGRVGRPALHLKATQVRLPQSVMDRIDALMGTHRRAKFIREAVENELARREAEKRG